MKKAYSKDYIFNTVKNLDIRAQKFTEDQIFRIMDDGYAELCTVLQAFTDEEVVSLDNYYTNEELQFSIDIEEDVIGIYDLYLTKENQNKDTYDHGIEQIRNKKLIYQDNRYNGRVHIDLEGSSTAITSNSTYDNAVIKYTFVPTHTTDTIYLDGQTWLALKSAFSMILYDEVHDVERNNQKRAEMVRRAKAVVPATPEDVADPENGRIFYGTDY